MFDVGFTEILLIGVVALVVIGPERLPAVAKTAGQWIGKLQRFVRGVKSDLASELQSGDLKKLIGDQRDQINELKQMVNSAKKDFESSSREVVQGAKKSLGELESSVKEADGGGSESRKPVALPAGSNPSGSEPLRHQDSSDSAAESKIEQSDLPAENKPATISPAVGSQAGAAPADPVKSPSSGRSSGNGTPTMRTGSSSSLEDPNDMNRTGTEPGN